MKMKDETYDITASFLIPAYSIPKNMTFNFFKKETHNQGTTLVVDFWAIGANKADPKQSILKALKNRAKNLNIRLRNAKKKQAQENNAEEIAKLSESAAFFNLAISAISEGRIIESQDIDAGLVKQCQNVLNKNVKAWEPDMGKSMIMLYKTPLVQYIQEKAKVKQN